MSSAELDRLIRRQAGVLTRNQLIGAGLRPRTIEAQVARGLWQRVGPGILLHHTAEPGLATQTRVTALWMPKAALTGVSAALLRPNPAWNDHVPGFCGPPMIIAPRASRGPWRTVRHPGARSAQSTRGRIASVHATLVDLLRFLPLDQALAIGAAAIRTGATTVKALERSVDALASLDSVQQLRSIVTDLACGAYSSGEVRLHAVLHQARIVGWTANCTVEVCGRTYILDVAFPAQRVYLEYDGVEAHGTAAFVGDRDRQNDLTAGGWRPIRVAWETLRDRRSELVARIRTALAEPVGPRG